jgi:hypothetical protein
MRQHFEQGRNSMQNKSQDAQSSKRLYWVTSIITVAAFIFWKFFDFTKRGQLGELNPFNEDPYDVVGSFAFQVVLLVALLTFARALRSRQSRAEPCKDRLTIRGNKIVLVTIGITLLTDGIALLRHPLPSSPWAHVLLISWGAMSAIELLCIAVFSIALLKTNIGPAPTNLTPADGLDDLWLLVRVAARILDPVLPSSFARWVSQFNSDKMFAKFRWLDAREHPWRFAMAVSLAAGIAIYLFKLTEGPSPNLSIAFVVAVIYISAELVATILGFTLLGGYLGLRPPLGRGQGASK